MIDLRHCAGCREHWRNMDGRCEVAATARLVPLVLIPLGMAAPYLDLPVKRRPACYRTHGALSVPPSEINAKGVIREAAL